MNENNILIGICDDNIIHRNLLNSYICKFFTNESWVILNPIEQSIKNKIETIGKPLKNWDINNPVFFDFS